MKFSNILSLFGLLTIGFLGACTGGTNTGDDASIKIEQLNGSWLVAKATRNGKATETLGGLYFRFSDAGQLSTNLLGSDMETPFELSGNKILQKSTPPLEYTIDKIDAKELVISTTLQEMDFNLTLERGE